MLSEPTAQHRVTQYATVGSSSSGTLVATKSFSGELNCVDAKRRDGRDSAASGSYCSLLVDGLTGQLCTGPAPSVEDWMYGQRAAREAREGSYARGDGSTSPWFDRSPGRPPYGRYRSIADRTGLLTVNTGLLSFSVGPQSDNLTVHTGPRTVHMPVRWTVSSPVKRGPRPDHIGLTTGHHQRGKAVHH